MSRPHGTWPPAWRGLGQRYVPTPGSVLTALPTRISGSPHRVLGHENRARAISLISIAMRLIASTPLDGFPP